MLRRDRAHNRQVNVRLVLHVLDADHLLFAGPSAEYPPIPKVGDQIVHELSCVRLEGISYCYRDNELEIGLLA